MLLWFLFACFVCFASYGRHRTWTIFGLCMRPCSLLILPKRRRCKMLHNVQLTQNCVTTWREPRRRRTEKKGGNQSPSSSQLGQNVAYHRMKYYIPKTLVNKYVLPQTRVFFNSCIFSAWLIFFTLNFCHVSKKCVCLSKSDHNSLMQGRTCATTWRKPRRRRTEKKILGRTTFGSPNSIYIYIYLSNPKNGHQTNRTVQ